MAEKRKDKQKFYYVWRKEFGYYAVNTDNPYWDAERKQMRHRYTIVGKSKTKDGPIEFGPKYRAQMTKENIIDALAISQTTTIGEYLVLNEAQKRVKIASALPCLGCFWHKKWHGDLWRIRKTNYLIS